MKYLLFTCYLIGKVFSGDGTCSVALPSSDERSCDYQNYKNDQATSENEASQSGNYKAPREVRPPSQSETMYPQSDNVYSTAQSYVTQAEYKHAVQDAANGNFATSIPLLRKAAKAWKSDEVYTNLCAFLLNWGHTVHLDSAVYLYNEAELNCNKALEVNLDYEDARVNLAALKQSREVRGLTVSESQSVNTVNSASESLNNAGRFVGQRKKKARKENADQVGEKVIMGFKEVYTEREEALRVYPGKMDNGDLEFKLYNGSIVNPRILTLRLGEVYVEDEFLSESELGNLIAIFDRGLLASGTSLEEGTKGTVFHSTLLSISSHLTAEERLLIAHIRERVVNRANDLRGLDAPMYSYLRGVRAHSTSLLRYKKSGRHNVHHDYDFVNRCLSASIGLSDSFEGGDFNLHTTKNVNDRTLDGFPIIGSVKGQAGRLMMFLSQSMNSVSELKSGTRDALYVWMTCDVDAEYQLDEPLEPVDDRKVWVATAKSK